MSACPIARLCPAYGEGETNPAKAAKLGVPTDRVPVIDVRGRLLLGFDKARIESLLGERT